MDDHLFFLLENFFNAGNTGLEWNYVINTLLKSAEYLNLKHSAQTDKEVTEIIQLYTDIHNPGGGQICIINELGKKAYALQKQIRLKKDELKQKDDKKDEIDLKIKQITISNGWMPKAAVSVAVLSICSTIILTITKSEKPYIPLREMQQLLQTQEQINKSLQQEVDALKDLIKSNAKNSDSGLHH